MQSFTLQRPSGLAEAARLGAEGGEFIAGGTDMLQLMKEWVRTPDRLVDLDPVLDPRIEAGPQGLRIGAGARMEAVAVHPEVARIAPAISEALLESASPQVRNLATMGGNLLQRTRCGYFRDAGVAACNKRRPGSGCAAIGGENRIHAVLGTSGQCIATHPSDFAVALVALEATLHLAGPDGERDMPIHHLYRTWDTHPEQETNLRPGEIIAAIQVPATALSRNARYLKVRDRAAFEWALLSAAVGLEIDGGTVRAARVAMGGVGTKPWRMRAVEAALIGKPANDDSYAAAAAHATEGAVARGENAYKITLMPRVLARALALAGGAA
ncbi:FAD binding domain-containing protein [Rhodopila globiformis]|uniref:FAD-binding molybdopterin dehydrogenase n=1 Tax=Rhodopila globiformis TaxID=1071 RepID=A0A2S6N8A6_RHOGL|nr:xanthine dehydrogenase family protein subunit M [Rhodopila globiformis]PPQ30852.1 FAD-binding molybdopterin dehydrogenase [Rhodopila globiformis]